MRGNPIVSIVGWLLYFALTVGIILVDRNIQRKRAAAQGGVDFKDRNPASYIVLALFCGPAPLIVYFGMTRKSLVGWLMGIGAAVGVFVVLAIVTAVLNVALHR